MRLRRLIIAALALALLPASSPPAQATGGAAADTGAVTLVVKPRALVGRKQTVTGTAPARNADVVIERYDELSRQWSAILRTTTTDDRSFRVRWKPERAGVARLRAYLVNDGARAASAAPERSVTLYRAQRATWYGPGFYGNRTACGQRMTRELVGVAHKTLRCGTRVSFLYRGRTLTVPVVDRGPYAEGFTWDLTAAAAEQLRFTGSGTIGALRQTASR